MLRISLLKARSACLVVLFGTCAVHADPADFVFDPYADEGSIVVQYAFGAEKLKDGSSEAAHSLALAWSPTARWFSAAYLGWYREPGKALSFYAVSWVNHFLLTDPGSPTRVGLYLEVERPRDRSAGYGLTWGPTLQVDLPYAQLNANVWLQRDVHADNASPTALTYQWQVKRLWRAHLEMGLQGFGNTGPWQHWSPASEQEHSLGPALFAKWPMGGNSVVRLDAGLLFGLTSASSSATLRLRTQYQF